MYFSEEFFSNEKSAAKMAAIGKFSHFKWDTSVNWLINKKKQDYLAATLKRNSGPSSKEMMCYCAYECILASEFPLPSFGGLINSHLCLSKWFFTTFTDLVLIE